MSSIYRDRTQSPSSTPRPFVLINSFTPKPGKLDELAALLESARDLFSEEVSGFHGGRIYRDIDESSVLMIGVFETEDDYESWIVSDLFVRHHARLRPLIDSMGQSRVEAGNARKTAHRRSADRRDDMSAQPS